MKKIEKLIFYKDNPFRTFINTLLTLTHVITCMAAIVMMVGFILKNGFVLAQHDILVIDKLYHCVWIIFIVDFLLNVILNFNESVRRYKMIAWFSNTILLTTLVPEFDSPPVYGEWLQQGYDVLASQWFRVMLILFLSLQKISSLLVGFLGKHTNPSQILAVSFWGIIIIGSGVLMLPKCTFDNITLSWIDSLFISCSAVCVTGLVPLDVATTFTPMGLTVIAILIQIGGVGVMTLTSFFAMFFMGDTSIYNQLAVRDMLSSKSLNSLLSTMRYILVLTFVIELMGMVSLWTSIHGTLDMTVNEELAFAAFHSVSAFCNAGFSTLTGNLGNSLILGQHTWFYVFISILIILGGIGFPILVNFKDITVYYILRLWSLIWRKAHVRRRQHIYNLNTKIVLVMTAILLFGGMFMLLIFEWNGAFAGMTIDDKLAHAFFNSACPRTAGFNSVDLTTLSVQSVLVYMILMWIGGSSQSTAGGLKVNAFAASFLNLVSVLRGKDRVEVAGRQISYDSIRRSNATVVLSFIVLFSAVFLLTIFEPNIPVSSLIFESISALSTVGSSLNITSLLGTPAKIIIILLMFIGRVGTLTLMLGFVKKKENTHYKYPSGTIIIN